ncbi:MAG: NUDIX domain-containing protein [Leptolyngbya sp. SIO1D8]|nr:NUDIX domain-containing protein [Leptolyngbya sp. SIO1D8]
MTSSSSIPIVDVLAWICLQDKCLLGARTTGNEVFYLPGGKREKGESDWKALSREVHEELSVALVEETFSEVVTIEEWAHGYAEPTQVKMKCFQADYVGELTPTSEIAEITWLSYADVERCAPASQRVLECLYKAQLII